MNYRPQSRAIAEGDDRILLLYFDEYNFGYATFVREQEKIWAFERSDHNSQGEDAKLFLKLDKQEQELPSCNGWRVYNQVSENHWGFVGVTNVEGEGKGNVVIDLEKRMEGTQSDLIDFLSSYANRIHFYNPMND